MTVRPGECKFFPSHGGWNISAICSFSGGRLDAWGQSLDDVVKMWRGARVAFFVESTIVYGDLPERLALDTYAFLQEAQA